MEKNKDNNLMVPYIVYEGAESKNERMIKRLIIVIILSVIMLFVSNMAWLNYFNNYDTVTYDQDGEGFNNLNTGKQGDVVNEPETENQNKEK